MTKLNGIETPAAEAIRLMGGPVAAARELKVDNYQAVQSWRTSGIPAKYCVRVEQLTGVDRKRLRPDDWADYWPPSGRPSKAKEGASA